MIPSRPLDLGDVFRETFRIYGKIFLRSALLFVIFIVPVSLLMVVSLDGALHSGLQVLEKNGGISDAKVQIIFERLHDSLSHSSAHQGETLSSSDTENWTSSDLEHWENTDQPNRLSGAEVWAEMAPSVTLFGGSCLLYIILYVMFIAAAVNLGCRSFEERKLLVKPTLVDALKRHGWNILLMGLLQIGAMAIVTTAVGLMIHESPWLGSLTVMAAIVAFVVVMIRLSLTVPVIVSEELGPIKAIIRSWNLTAGNWWRVFGIQFIVGFVASIVLNILAWIFTLPVIFTVISKIRDMNGVKTIAGLESLIQTCLHSYLGAIAIPTLAMAIFSVIPPIVLYYDLRTRHDGPLVYPDNQPKTPVPDVGGLTPMSPAQ